MKSARFALLALVMGAVPALAQNYAGTLDTVNCGTLGGWAWDSNFPTGWVYVDLYDGPVFVGTASAQIYRAGLPGNGYHAFSYPTPAVLKDGRTHNVNAVFSGTQTHLNGGTLPLWCSPGSIGYQPYFTSPLTSLPGGTWYTNGSVSAGATGLSSSGSGSAILAQAAPGNANFYLVDSTINLTGSGGTFITYLHATSNAKSGSSPQGTFYSVEIQNVVTNGAQYSGTLAINRCLNGSLTQFASFPVNLRNGSTVRTVMTAAQHILVFIDGVFLVDQVDSSITSGQPGLGVSSTGSNSISAVSFGPYDGIAPTAISASTFAATVKKTSILLRWQPTVDDPNGSGIWRYDVTRWDSGTGQPVYLGAYTEPVISDTTMTPGHSYVYQVAVSDYFENGSYTTSATLVVPSNDDIDPRQVGVRPNGTYWGGAGEQINMRSGNVNFTVPLMKAMARSGWGVGFSLSYNSQNWLQDAGYSWKIGNDVGFGFGWKLQAGSLTPVYNGYFTVAYYQFVDASGAEYRLLPVGSGIFASSEAIYLWFDSNAGRLYFKDGSFWIFGCTSAGTEQDAGTLYPTTMEDTNGNQITIQYGNGVNATWPNSSARIGTVWDVRGNFTFNYTQDALPHISSIWSPDNNNYSFTIPTGQALNSPFGGTSFGNTALLSTVTGVDGLGGSPSLATNFTYDSSGNGELTKMTTPYGGYLNWQYVSSALSAQRTVRELQNRYVLTAPGATIMSYQLTRDPGDTGRSVHWYGQWFDWNGNASKVWWFGVPGPSPATSDGLVTAYEGRQLPSNTAYTHEDYTWYTTPTSGNPYISKVVTTENSNNSPIQKQSVQTLDQYGNLTQLLAYDYGNLSAWARKYTNTFATDGNYLSRHIYNRVLTSTVVDAAGNTSTLASNCYDGLVGCSGGTTLTSLPMGLHDGVYGTSYAYRGNLTKSVTPGGTVTNSYDIGGNVTSSTKNGVTSTTSTSASSNYTAPSQITTNSLTTSLNWTGFLGLSQATGPNGDTMLIGYGGFSRPSSSTSPYGAVTNYYYADTASPPQKYAITNGHGTRTTMDGFGRTIKVETGTASGTWPNLTFTTVSSVDSQYAACGCSPLGKLWRTSQPYAPGGSQLWTTYTYDALGRATQVTLPDGSSKTTYSYSSNTATVTDPAGKTKTFKMDAFGNLTSVTEPGSLVTTYSYDVLNHLIQVTMPRTVSGTVYTQTRTFNYKTGSTVGVLLLSATNPENGTVAYTYNSNNLLASKTDAKNQQTQYGYDSYNRVTQVRHYPVAGGAEDTAQQVNYYYDSNPDDPGGSFSTYTAGRLAEVKYSGARTSFAEWYGYTQPGSASAKRLRVQQYVQWGNFNANPAINLDASYSFDNEGKMKSVAYPATTSGSGPSYTYSFDGMARPSGLTDQSGNAVVNNVSYGAANQLLTMGWGNPQLGYTNETRTYNSLLQLTNITTMTGVTTLMNKTYTYPAAGANNGKIVSQGDSMSGETVAYAYDALNRLITATAGSWSENYTYDGFGNLTTKTPTGAAPSLSVYVDPNTNRGGGSFDANGNQTSMQSYAMGYDVENRMTAMLNLPSVSYYYAYDQRNQRVWAWNGATDQYGNPTGYTVYFYGVNGSRLGVYSIAVSIQGTSASLTDGAVSTESYFGRRRLAVQDRLGSTTANSGGFFPYGEDKGTVGANDNWKFATYWRDSVSGLDYAVNRYYSSTNGRFTTPDSYQGSAGPQIPNSWNRYTYAGGDPVGNLDSKGLDWCPAGASADLCAFMGGLPDSDPEAQCVEAAWNFGYLEAQARCSGMDPNYGMGIDGLLLEAAQEGQAARQAAAAPVPPTCDPGWAGTSYGGFSADDLNFAARAIFAESSGNFKEDVAIADVIVNRLHNPGFDHGLLATLTAVVSQLGQFNAVTPPGPSPKFLESAPQYAQYLQPADCLDLAGAITAMESVATTGSTLPFTFFAAAGTPGTGGTRIGGSVFWGSWKPKRPRSVT